MRPLGVYVHFPFCQRRCPYCDFRVDVVREIPHRAYADAVIAELRARAEATRGRTLRTLYFGGGTPSLWRPEELERVVEAVRAEVGAGEEPVEITVEVNPTAGGLAATAREVFARLRAVGVDRVSLGVQSFDDARLELLGRWHSADDAHAALEEACAAGFERVSFDLMCALPDQRPDEWSRELERAAAHLERAPAGHVSVYELTYHAGTPFEQRRAAGKLRAADEDESADMLAHTARWMAERGLARYEVSNYARPGHESRHNAAYWQGVEYLGLGVGAHSMERRGEGVVRRANGPKTAQYLASGGECAHEEERLSLAEHWVERLYLGLRTSAGVDLARIEGELGQPPAPELAEALGECEERGLLRREGDRWWPTESGLDFADDVALALFSVSGSD